MWHHFTLSWKLVPPILCFKSEVHGICFGCFDMWHVSWNMLLLGNHKFPHTYTHTLCYLVIFLSDLNSFCTRCCGGSLALGMTSFCIRSFHLTQCCQRSCMLWEATVFSYEFLINILTKDLSQHLSKWDLYLANSTWKKVQYHWLSGSSDLHSELLPHALEWGMDIN